MGGFVVTMVYGFSWPTGDLDVLEIAPRDAGRPVLELGTKGGPLHEKYKIYLDQVGVAAQSIQQNRVRNPCVSFAGRCQHYDLPVSITSSRGVSSPGWPTQREVILLESAGLGRSTGEVPEKASVGWQSTRWHSWMRSASHKWIC
jgi:hypothetical protein